MVPGPNGITAIATGYFHTCALTAAGGVLCWGYNVDGQLGNNSTAQSNVPVAVSGLSAGVTAVSAGLDQTCAITTANGLVCWGFNAYGQVGNGATGTNVLAPVMVVGLPSSMATVAAGHYHTCALSSTGGVFCPHRREPPVLGLQHDRRPR